MTRHKRPARRIAAAAGLALAMLGATSGSASAAAGTVTANKTLSATDISCSGSTDVTLTLQGETGIAGNPVDIVLVLDRSGSMVGAPLANMKTGANAFVDVIDEATDGVLDGVIANGSRVGVVSFSDNATVNEPLTTNAGALKSDINALVASGGTNHTAAINTAQAQLAGSNPASEKVMIIFTDGQSVPSSANGLAAANAAKAAGTEIFAIGLGSVNVGQLNAWASDPDSEHVFIAPSSADLEAIFEAIGAAIVVPAASNITVVDTVDDHFGVSNVMASKGNVAQTGNQLTWTIDELNTETVTLTFTATHDNTKSGGVEQVNASVAYTDAEGNVVTFPNPTVNVRGCAAALDLAPATDTNTVGDNHTVTVTVTDDFGDPVAGVNVDFGVIGGPSVVDGDPSAPNPANGVGVTDAAGEATFTYTNTEASPDTISATAPTQPNVAVALSDTATKTWNPLTAVIDIKPGSDPNSFGAKSQGNIPVALLGSATFDVSLVDDSTVRFGDAPSPLGDASAAKGGKAEDVNGDGVVDRVYHFSFQDTNLDPSDTQGCLGGEINGLDFLSCDAVNIV
jgi:uncharacterized protein YegL